MVEGIHSPPRNSGRHSSLEPIALCAPIAGHDNNHLVELWPNLDATSQPAVGMLLRGRPGHRLLLGARHWIELVAERIRDHHMALAAGDTGTIVVERNLVRRKSMLGIAAAAVGEDAWCFVSRQDVKQALSGLSCVPARNSIRRQNVNPYTTTHKDDAINKILRKGNTYIWSTTLILPFSSFGRRAWPPPPNEA